MLTSTIEEVQDQLIIMYGSKCGFKELQGIKYILEKIGYEDIMYSNQSIDMKIEKHNWIK